MDSLLKLRIMGCSLSELKVVDGLKKLKILTVRRLANLNFLGSMDALLELSITFVSGRELKEHDLSNIVQRFKNLQKLNIRVIDYSIQAREYAEIVIFIGYYSQLKERRQPVHRTGALHFSEQGC